MIWHHPRFDPYRTVRCAHVALSCGGRECSGTALRILLFSTYDAFCKLIGAFCWLQKQSCAVCWFHD